MPTFMAGQQGWIARRASVFVPWLRRQVTEAMGRSVRAVQHDAMLSGWMPVTP